MAWAPLLALAVACSPLGGPAEAVGSSSKAPPRLGGRVLGGKGAFAGQLPFQAKLSPWANYHHSFCGGSLIAEQWVLTAGHCIAELFKEIWFPRMEATLGATDISIDESTVQKQWTDSIKPHPKFRPTDPWLNDIALLHFPKPFRLNKFVQIISLPSAEEGRQRAGLHGIIAGWGQDRTSNLAGQTWLKVGESHTTDEEACRRADSWWNGEILLCIAGWGQDDAAPCFGDSGGPFVSGGKLYGISSTAAKDCESGGPATYTAVGAYLDWINGYLHPPSARKSKG